MDSEVELWIVEGADYGLIFWSETEGRGHFHGSVENKQSHGTEDRLFAESRFLSNWHPRTFVYCWTPVTICLLWP